MRRNFEVGDLQDKFVSGTAKNDETSELFRLCITEKLSVKCRHEVWGVLLKESENMVVCPARDFATRTAELWLQFRNAGLDTDTLEKWREYHMNYVKRKDLIQMTKEERDQYRAGGISDLDKIFLGRIPDAPVAPTAEKEPVPEVRRSVLKKIVVVCLAIAVIAIGTMVAIWFLQQPHEEQDALVYAGALSLNLPDSSAVILTRESELSHQKSFGKNGIRQVILKGSAYFEIASNPLLPFHVECMGTDIEVLGTGFNVESNEERGTIKVAVAHGKVMVRRHGREYGTITPGQQLTINIHVREARFEAFDPRQVDWPYPNLVFDGVTLAEAARQIEDHFHVKVLFSAEISQCRISGVFFDGEVNIRNVVETISKIMTGARYTMNSGIVTFIGDRCELQPGTRRQ